MAYFQTPGIALVTGVRLTLSFHSLVQQHSPHPVRLWHWPRRRSSPRPRQRKRHRLRRQRHPARPRFRRGQQAIRHEPLLHRPRAGSRRHVPFERRESGEGGCGTVRKDRLPRELCRRGRRFLRPNTRHRCGGLRARDARQYHRNPSRLPSRRQSHARAGTAKIHPPRASRWRNERASKGQYR